MSEAEHFTLWESPSTFVGLKGVVYAGPGLEVESFCLLGSEHGALEIGRNALIRSHSVIEGDVKIGEGFECGHHVLIRRGVTIGRNVKIGSYTSLEGNVHVASGAQIGGRVQMGSYVEGGAILYVGNDARIYLGARFLDRRQPPDGKYEPPSVGARAIIGAGALILPGAIVCNNAMVAAGAIVDTDVDPGMLFKRDGSQVPRR